MNILVGNLNERTTVVHLMRLFIPFGIVRSVNLITDGTTGHSSCIGIVTMSYRAGIVAIDQLNNLNFMNHYLELTEIAE